MATGRYPAGPWGRGLLGRILLGLMLWVGLSARVHGAPSLATVAQVGATSAGQNHYVLLMWHPLDGYELGPAYAVYRKAGLPEKAGDFALLAVVQPTTDVPTLTLRLAAAGAAGLDLAGAEQALDGLLTGVTLVGPSLAHKVAAALTANLEKERRRLFQEVLPRTHPAIAVALGRGHIVEVPATELSTFEVRDYDLVSGEPGAVVASVTTGLAPIVLPAPGALSERVEPTPRGHLRVLLRWCTPVDLAQRALHVAGYHVYRARRTAWQAAQGSAPPAQLTVQAFDAARQSGLLEQVTRTPVLPEETFACGGLMDPASYFLADDNDTAAKLRFEDGGVPFQPGEQVTYYARALDHFRRPGLPSSGLDVTVCDRMPPLVPKGLRVEERPGYDEALNVGTQHLVVSWDRAATQEVVRYWIYRWTSHDAALKMAGQPAVSNLLARIDNVGPGERLEFVDDGTAQMPTAPPAPSLPGDAGRTFWYTVRAEDSGTCLSAAGHANLSGPSAPGFGVLRDWVGPDAPGGGVNARCCAVTGTFAANTSSITNGVVSIQWQRSGPVVAWVELRETGGKIPRRRVDFAAVGNVLSMKVPIDGLGAIQLESRFGLRTGQRSAWIPALPLNSATATPLLVWTANVKCARVRGGCDPGFSDPEDPSTGDVTSVCGDVVLPNQAVEWRVYRRVDMDSRLVQIESGRQQTTEWCDTGAPASATRLCYFAQTFDMDGNPSAITRLGCVDVAGTEPMPRPEITRAYVVPPQSPALTMVPALLDWFCARAGVERFEIAFRPPPPGAPEVVWLPVAGAQEMIGTEHGVYRSPRLPSGFGGGGTKFGQGFQVLSGQEYRVRVRAIRTQISESGGTSVLTGEWSEEALLSFVQGTAPQGPQVPWPARPVPGIHPDFFPRAEFDALDQIGKVEIGTISVTDVVIPGTETSPARVRGRSLDPYLTVSVPFAVYRHEVSPGHRGEMTQITPFFEDFRITQVGTPGNPVIQIDDPFVQIRRRVNEPLGPYRIWIRDTQPLIRGKSYVYTVVRHREDREIHEVLASTVANVPE